MLSKKAVPMGAMCMVFATLVNYHIYITQSLARRSERASLAHLAYDDELTGIPNRNRYEKYISDLDKKENDYCIISIDLNGLKKVNDELGHLAGDKYIAQFGKCLSQCMEGQAFVARIGGDEFVAVLSGNNILRAQEFIQELCMKLDELNKKDPSIYRNAACGFAYRHEVSKPDMNAVYLLADERMYLDKRKKKQTS
jgi:diguanylate cyclase (GGDEF)-like protein